ncbi:hypothetical protein EIP86_001335 [Pleurotus ostreatoroseus]|nr:hypothetical protein EIP86_001335 [Pleurotus ostreatoroseus]
MDPDQEDTHNKKPRTARTSATAPRPAAAAAPKAGPSTSSHPRYDTSEDGELTEDPHPHPAEWMPQRRPVRSKKDINFYELHDKYQRLGRNFKYSGDRRIASTFNSKNPNHRPLRRPPPPNSPYHKHANILARLELLDGLMCFIYAFWCSDTSRGRPHIANWVTMANYLKHCKSQWPTTVADDREKALGGLVWMIQAYIHGRSLYDTGEVWKNQAFVCQQLQSRWAAEKAQQQQHRATPPMLPSPASISAGSANSTPAGRSTPLQKDATDPASSAPQRQNPGAPEPELVPPHLTAPINYLTMRNYATQSAAVHDARHAMEVSQLGLTLPVLNKYFPRTFQRMIHTSYSAADEHAPDFEDDEGELFWPSQVITGQGIGWLCHMGRAMIREFGREYGYRGAEGLLWKHIEDDGRTEGPRSEHAPLTPAAQDKR